MLTDVPRTTHRMYHPSVHTARYPRQENALHQFTIPRTTDNDRGILRTAEDINHCNGHQQRGMPHNLESAAPHQFDQPFSQAASSISYTHYVSGYSSRAGAGVTSSTWASCRCASRPTLSTVPPTSLGPRPLATIVSPIPPLDGALPVAEHRQCDTAYPLVAEGSPRNYAPRLAVL